jgi:hypothetical protein
MSEKVTVVTRPDGPARVFKDRKAGADQLNRDDRPSRRHELGKFIERRIDKVITFDGTVEEVEVE